MALAPGSHTVGPEQGTLVVCTFREGVAQQVGHDLILGVRGWEATVEVGNDGALASVQLTVDPRSLEVEEGLRGVKPLTDKDRAKISQDIDAKILRGAPIEFRSDAVTGTAGRVAVTGELTIAGNSRAVDYELGVADDGRVSARLQVTQSEWGIKPYRAFMGALKVRDAIEIALDVQLPTA